MRNLSANYVTCLLAEMFKGHLILSIFAVAMMTCTSMGHRTHQSHIYDATSLMQQSHQTHTQVSRIKHQYQIALLLYTPIIITKSAHESTDFYQIKNFRIVQNVCNLTRSRGRNRRITISGPSDSSSWYQWLKRWYSWAS